MSLIGSWFRFYKLERNRMLLLRLQRSGIWSLTTSSCYRLASEQTRYFSSCKLRDINGEYLMAVTCHDNYCVVDRDDILTREQCLKKLLDCLKTFTSN